METPTTPGGEQPQAPITTEANAPAITTPNPETPTPPAAPEAKPDAQPAIDELLAQVQLSEMSNEQLADIESGDPARIRAALGIKAGPEGAAATEAAKPAAPAPDDDRELKRISLKAIKSPDERAAVAQAVQLVREGKHDSLSAALAEVFKLNSAPPAAKADDPPPSPAVDDGVKAIEDKIAALEADRKHLKSAAGGYEYDAAEEKLAEIMELKLDLRDAKREAAAKAEQAKANQGAQAKWEEDESASRARALEKYGEMMTDPDSAFADYVEVEIALAERKNDNILSQPDWPEKIADRVKEKYFKDNGAAYSAPELPASKIPAPPPGIRLPGSPVGNAANSVALTAPAAAVEFDKLTEEQRFAALTLAEERLSKRR